MHSVACVTNPSVESTFSLPSVYSSVSSVVELLWWWILESKIFWQNVKIVKSLYTKIGYDFRNKVFQNWKLSKNSTNHMLLNWKKIRMIWMIHFKSQIFDKLSFILFTKYNSFPWSCCFLGPTFEEIL